MLSMPASANLSFQLAAFGRIEQQIDLLVPVCMGLLARNFKQILGLSFVSSNCRPLLRWPSIEGYHIAESIDRFLNS